MVRQYIGARYVPKFTGEYDATLAYEPLSIVQVGNNFYTSKIPVPPGTPVTNTTYWALTGNYNGAIVDLQNSLDEISGEVEQIGERYPRRPYFRPEDYGGKVNDESVDNTYAIKAALDAANEVGGVVLLSAGIYHCLSGIVITDRFMCVDIIGAGMGLHSTGKGTIIFGHGNNFTLSFTGGMWRVNFADLAISNDSSSGGCLYFGEENAYDARSYEVTFTRCVFNFDYIGTWLFNPTYVTMDMCHWRGNPATRVNNRRCLILGGTAITDRNTVEYVSVLNSTMNSHMLTQDVTMPAGSAAIYINRGSHISVHFTDMTGNDNALLVETDYPVTGLDMYSCDMSDVYEAIKVVLKSNSLQKATFDNLYVTGMHVHESNNRVLRIIKQSGGAAYAADIEMPNIWTRGGFGTILYQADAGSLYPGQVRIRSCNSYEGSITSYDFPSVVRTESLGTVGATADQERVTDGDFNNYTISGFIPKLFTADCTNGPGYTCYLLVFASSVGVTQVAISTGSAHGISSRIFNNNTWSAWSEFSRA